MKPFQESLNTAVITTKWVLDGEPILNVYHHEDDGMWEFTGSTQGHEDSDYKVISLEEVIQRDPTIQHVSELPLGYCANRTAVDILWAIGKIFSIS